METLSSTGSLTVTIDERDLIRKLEEMAATDRVDEPLLSATSQRIFRDYLLSTEVYRLEVPKKRVS